jgi:hypothetical protein
LNYVAARLNCFAVNRQVNQTDRGWQGENHAPTSQESEFETPTGYAQLLMDPMGWANDYTEKLPPVEGTTVKRYRLNCWSWYRNQERINMDVQSIVAELRHLEYFFPRLDSTSYMLSA